MTLEIPGSEFLATGIALEMFLRLLGRLVVGLAGRFRMDVALASTIVEAEFRVLRCQNMILETEDLPKREVAAAEQLTIVIFGILIAIPVVTLVVSSKRFAVFEELQKSVRGAKANPAELGTEPNEVGVANGNLTNWRFGKVVTSGGAQSC